MLTEFFPGFSPELLRVFHGICTKDPSKISAEAFSGIWWWSVISDGFKGFEKGFWGFHETYISILEHAHKLLSGLRGVSEI